MHSRNTFIRTHEINFYFQGDVAEVTFVGANPKNSAENRVSISESFYKFKFTFQPFIHLDIPLEVNNRKAKCYSSLFI